MWYWLSCKESGWLLGHCWFMGFLGIISRTVWPLKQAPWVWICETIIILPVSMIPSIPHHHHLPLHHAMWWIVSFGYGYIIFQSYSGLILQLAVISPDMNGEIDKTWQKKVPEYGIQRTERGTRVVMNSDTHLHTWHMPSYIARVNACGSIVCGAPSVPWHGIPQTASHAVRGWGWSTLTHCLTERERESHGVY